MTDSLRALAVRVLISLAPKVVALAADALKREAQKLEEK
jgi:hypothetical protein